MKRFVHTSYPVWVCSLTTDRSRFLTEISRRVVTKSRDGKPGNGGLQGNQSGEANRQIAGRRTTAGIVKVKHRESLPEMLKQIGKVERPFYARRPTGILEELGMSRNTAHGVKDDDMSGKSNSATGEVPGTSVETDKPRYKVDCRKPE